MCGCSLRCRHVMEVLGAQYVEPQPFNLGAIFAESSASSPLVFILSPGSDPLSDLLKFADSSNTRVESVSLGQGQGPVALDWIRKGDPNPNPNPNPNPTLSPNPNPNPTLTLALTLTLPCMYPKP